MAFIPHGHCYLWRRDLVLLNVSSDALIGLAYFSIPLMLLYVVRQRQDIPFPWLFTLFGAFIVSCGSTHLLSVWTIWHPSYWVSTGVKALTASVSILTAATMIPVLPRALSLPSPKELDIVNQSLKREIAERQQAEAEVRRLNNELETRIQERTAALEDSNRQVEQLLSRERQTLEQVRQAKAKIEDYSEQLNAVFEQAAIGISQVGLDGQWLRVNQRLCDIVGYSRAELLAKTFQDITHAADAERDRQVVEAVLAGAPSAALEKRYVHKDGHLVWVKITVSLVRQRQGTDRALPGETSVEVAQVGAPKYFVGIVEEIGDRKRTEAALQRQTQHLKQVNRNLKQTTRHLEERNEELNQFAYVVSHDLKAPLRGIANLTVWLIEDLSDTVDTLEPEIQHQLELIEQRVTRMQNLIDGLLTYYRAGRIPVDSTPITVQTLLQETIDSLAIPAQFNVIIQPQEPALVVAPLLLNQVFANLISNAVKHHNKSTGQVVIRWDSDALGYRFSIVDDGPGIDPAHHDRIFQIFQTLDSKDIKENTGIGLSIVKKIVESVGGQIQVEAREGQGTSFSFTWPDSLDSPEPHQ